MQVRTELTSMLRIGTTYFYFVMPTWFYDSMCSLQGFDRRKFVFGLESTSDNVSLIRGTYLSDSEISEGRDKFVSDNTALCKTMFNLLPRDDQFVQMDPASSLHQHVRILFNREEVSCMLTIPSVTTAATMVPAVAAGVLQHIVSAAEKLLSAFARTPGRTADE